MRYLVCSDIHLGHPNTPTTHIINSFKSSILTDENKDIDVLFIAGDLFDRLLDFNSKEVQEIIIFFNELLTFCTANNILLRVLEGTPSHDWSQSQILVKLNEIRTNKCDLRYHKSLDIEFIPSISKHVLYIPDEWTHDHIDLEEQIHTKLIEHNLTKVDIAILHGQFKYQLIGKKYTGFYFKEEYFLDLVKNYIHVGHYHSYSKFDRIIANGSLERLAHGEESSKGYIKVIDSDYIFIENKNSYVYKTINVNANATLEKLDKQIYKYPKESHIRLLMSSDHSFNLIFSELKLRYLDYKLKKLIKEYASEDNTVTYILNEEDIDSTDKYVLVNNIHQTLLNIVHSKYTLNSEESDILLEYMSIFKEANTDERLTTE